MSDKNSAFVEPRHISEFSEKEYTDFRLREKGYALIALILHIVLLLIPAMALSVSYTALPYTAAFVPLIGLTVGIYRIPDRSDDGIASNRKHRVKLLNTLIMISRILAILTPALIIYANFRMDLGISIWLIIQVGCLLLEGLMLQFLFRHRKKVRFE